MDSDIALEAQLRAARQLALHLRQNPEDATRSPADLAEQFGLPASFVENVISGVQGTARRSEPWLPRIDLTFLVRAYQWVDRLFDKVTRNPVLFVIFTTVLCLAFSYFFRSSTEVQLGGRTSRVTSDGFTVLIAVLVTFALHLGCFFRRRMVRYAMLSGLALWIGLSFLVMISMWLEMKDQEQGVLAGLLLLASFGMFVVCSIYAAIGGGAAVLGAYIDMLRHNLREDRMSRQELLEHYFQLQERLDASQGLTPREGIFDTDFVKALINTGPLWALLTGLLLGTIKVLLTVASGVAMPGAVNLNWAIFAQLVLAVVVLIVYILAGFFAKNFWMGFLQSLAVSIGGLPPILIGTKLLNLPALANNESPLALLISAIGYAVVSFFGALGGVVQRRAAKELNLAQNDPASILAEMVRIQWKLSDRRSCICVMVVDAAKSSEMKSYADPLAVEYSFREYQNLLETLSRTLNGRVHSTAGDGAVIAFGSAVEAFSAAKRIQTDIERFNREDNRLQLPFRLRIGLHMGEIVGDLDEVEFTEVIDIAAHVQAAAPVGGIAVTESVSEHLPVEEFIPLAKQIDGQNVLLALNPMVDEPWQTRST